MNLMKIMPAALLLSLSLGVYAQDEDLSEDAVAEDEAVEVAAPTHPWEAPIFHRVQVGFAGTIAKYTNDGSQNPILPKSEDYFLKGGSVGWMCDIKLVKKMPLYLELGPSLAWQTGSTSRGPEGKFLPTVESRIMNYETSVQAFTLTIPVSVNYQLRNFMGVDGFMLAPFIGPYIRFNIIAKRKQTATETIYYPRDAAGNYAVKEVNITEENKTLMDDNLNGHDGWMEGRTHRGKLVQVGAQAGANAFYKHFSFGLAYMCDLTPFAKHSLPNGLYSEPRSVGGVTCSSGTGCDMEVSTRHNFAVTVGYVF